MATRLRKGRHQRGSRTHGWGTSGQHRASGMRGGFGRAGRYRHKRSRLIRTGEFVHLHYAGKKGFTPLSSKQSKGEVAVNLWQLSEIADRLASEKKTEPSEKVVVDLGQLGIRKLLGAGVISRPVQVKVDKCSESALKKLKEAGGEAVLKTPAAPVSAK